MIKVIIVGTGNVSYHLQRAFSKTESIDVIQIFPGRSDFNSLFSSKNSDHRYFEDVDVIIICVSDDVIEAVSKHFEKIPKLIVHTSGSISVNAIRDGARSGVFYPLQTFSKKRQVDFKNIPICLEANESKDMELLKKMASSISDTVNEIDSKQRKAIHLAAVFANNFSNHLYQIGSEICEEGKVPFDLLKPLIAETAAKIETLNPIEAQTGPARRNDMETIKKHLVQLQNIKHKELYSTLTESIQNTYGEKL